MNVLVISLDGVSPESLFGDERLVNLRRLMQVGCYGKLARADFAGAASARAWMQHQAWDYQHLANAPEPGDLNELDAELGRILEALTDDTALLIVSPGSAAAPAVIESGCFILAASNNPLLGEIEGARLIDLAPTLLELSGQAIPETLQGKALVAGKVAPADAGLSQDEEEIIRARLAGLGYIE